MASWLAQSIQRRLLLYFLQKISLFSQVNTSTLDVSLGSKSDFTFHDLNLDVEGISIPDAAIRSGTIENLHLRLTVSGGVDVEGNGITFVIKPNASLTAQTDSPTFSLTKTVFDLTNSVMQMTNEDTSCDTENDESSSTDDLQGERVTSSAPSMLEAMRNKALDIALSKLSIKLRNITFRFLFANNHAIEFRVEEAHFVTANDSREVKLRGIHLTHIWTTSDVKDEASLSVSDSLSDSLVYSKAEATSIYMSAIQSIEDINPQDPFRAEAEKVTEILNIDDASVSFKGLKSIEDLGLRDMVFEIGHINVDFSQLLNLDDQILRTISVIALQKSNKDKYQKQVNTAQKLQNYKRFQQEQDIHEELTLSKIRIDSLTLRLSSVMKLTLSKIGLTLHDNGTTNVIINDLKLFEGLCSKIKEDKVTDLPFLFLLIDSNKKAASVSIQKFFHVDITETMLKDLVTFACSFNKCMKVWRESSDGMNTSSSELSDSLTLKIDCEPLIVAYTFSKYALQIRVDRFVSSLSSVLFSTSSIVVTQIEKTSTHHELFRVNDIKITTHTNSVQIDTFDEKMNDVIFSTKVIGEIGQITFKINEKQVSALSLDFITLVNKFLPLFDDNGGSKCSPAKTKQHRLLKKSVRIMSSSSIIYKQASAANFILRIGKIRFKIFGLLCDHFGSLDGSLNHSIFQMNADNSFTFHCTAVGVERLSSSGIESLVTLINEKDTKKPCVVLHRRSSKRVVLTLRNLEGYYYARWLDLLDMVKKGNSRSTKATSKTESSNLVEIKLFDCALLLHPYRLNSQLAVILGRSVLEIDTSNFKMKGSFRSCSLMLIDDVGNSKVAQCEGKVSLPLLYRKLGFADIGKVETFSITIEKIKKTLNIDLYISHVSLSLCADSTHTLLQTCIDLKIPVSFPDDKKYRTKIRPINLFEDVDMDFFTSNKLQVEQVTAEEPAFTIIDDFLDHDADLLTEYENSGTSCGSNSNLEGSENFKPRENHLDSLKMKYCPSGPLGEEEETDIVFSLNISKIALKLYDGFDWSFTRRSISEIIARMETELRAKDIHDTEQVKATAFDSIYFVAPNGDSDGGGLKRMINEEIQSAPGISLQNTVKKLKLRPSKNYKVLVDVTDLKMIFTGYGVDEPTEPESDLSADILNKISISIENIDVIDNVPTSTWNKFLTQLKEEPRADAAPMLNMKLKTVRPIDFLAATELILNVKLLPLRLHVDQDTLDFLTRFGEFKDERFELIDQYPDLIYLQKIDINGVKIKLDYKPKKVDYVGLKSGHTSEFMNFFILDGSKMKLKHVVLYGVNGFPELSKSLNSIWMPDITGTQLASVLSGVAPMKSIVTLGSGVKALVTYPIKEYKKDQTITRGVQKGTQVFMKITTGEFVRLGVKLASGTQAVLENTEELFGGKGSQARNFKITDLEVDLVPEAMFRKYEKLVGGTNPLKNKEEPDAMIVELSEEDSGNPKIISLYADQPATVHNGLKQARSSLEKNVYIAYDALKKAQNEIRESESAHDTAISLARAVPVAILRPLIGASEALSKALQGISNEIDEEQAVYLQDKYKSTSSSK
ncbi:LAFE_0H00672g1_1 [Lachancea fermentati]|uniref:Autophagy-related protein 2 n=1 Tax=Lachancea fermentati TaxID=4955 RepID=A0A1G4MJ25_LACFM|nr:LAFE_0H00672g1_1 [Lachancea fermentati]